MWPSPSGRTCRDESSPLAGFTLVELVAVIAILAVLFGVALQRFMRYQELAERAAMDATLRFVKTALQLRLAELIVERRESEARSLERTNPMRWLAEVPGNYAGLYHMPVKRGTWYFDAPLAELVYVVNNGGSLEVAASNGAKEIRFRVQVLRGVVDFGSASTETVTGITLLPVYPYRWSRFDAPIALA